MKESTKLGNWTGLLFQLPQHILKEKHHDNTEKIVKAITKKFKNRKGTTASKEPNASSSKDFLEEIEKPSESILNVETTIEQQILPSTVATETATIAESCDNSNITAIEDQNTPIVDNVEETTVQEPNTSDSLSLAEIKPCNAAKEKPSTKTTQQRQAILAGFIGTALLAASVALYILEMHVVAVIGGIVGLICIGFALYNAIKPNTKFEKVEEVEQLTAQPCLNPM
ncbi:hypothetical protein [Wolbachia pipientis]|uniref:hypothetical protein n=1 Tax=Wolbachia pipientis TaxID=955 RepID=UPI00202F46DB|nr:hypothetical protein [Wolbachia pipientis]